MINFENLKENDSGHWIYKGQTNFEVPLGAFGFVYLIEQKFPGADTTKYRYIGRKYLTAAKTSSKRVLLKSGARVTKKKKSRVESDWRNYMGSCFPLLDEIEKLGKDSFRFEILCFCFTKGQVNFAEEFAQMRAGVIFDDSFFNESIGSGSFRGVKFTSEFKDVLREIKI